MGLSFVGTHQAFKVKDKQIVCTNSGHAPMGWGLPAAIGSIFRFFKSNQLNQGGFYDEYTRTCYSNAS